MARVKLDLGATKATIKQLRDFDKILFQGAEFLRGKILSNWSRAKSPDGSPFKSLSTKAYYFNVGTATSPRWMTFEGGYKEFKQATGRKGIRNLNFTGKMTQGFYVDNSKAFVKTLKFRSPEIPKARGNYNRTPNMLTLSRKIEKLTVNVINNLFWKKIRNK